MQPQETTETRSLTRLRELMKYSDRVLHVLQTQDLPDLVGYRELHRRAIQLPVNKRKKQLPKCFSLMHDFVIQFRLLIGNCSGMIDVRATVLFVTLIERSSSSLFVSLEELLNITRKRFKNLFGAGSKRTLTMTDITNFIKNHNNLLIRRDTKVAAQCAFVADRLRNVIELQPGVLLICLHHLYKETYGETLAFVHPSQKSDTDFTTVNKVGLSHWAQKEVGGLEAGEIPIHLPHPWCGVLVQFNFVVLLAESLHVFPSVVKLGEYQMIKALSTVADIMANGLPSEDTEILKMFTSSFQKKSYWRYESSGDLYETSHRITGHEVADIQSASRNICKVVFGESVADQRRYRIVQYTELGSIGYCMRTATYLMGEGSDPESKLSSQVHLSSNMVILKGPTEDRVITLKQFRGNIFCDLERLSVELLKRNGGRMDRSAFIKEYVQQHHSCLIHYDIWKYLDKAVRSVRAKTDGTEYFECIVPVCEPEEVSPNDQPKFALHRNEELEANLRTLLGENPAGIDIADTPKLYFKRFQTRPDFSGNMKRFFKQMRNVEVTTIKRLGERVTYINIRDNNEDFRINTGSVKKPVKVNETPQEELSAPAPSLRAVEIDEVLQRCDELCERFRYDETPLDEFLKNLHLADNKPMTTVQLQQKYATFVQRVDARIVTASAQSAHLPLSDVLRSGYGPDIFIKLGKVFELMYIRSGRLCIGEVSSPTGRNTVVDLVASRMLEIAKVPYNYSKSQKVFVPRRSYQTPLDICFTLSDCISAVSRRPDRFEIFNNTKLFEAKFPHLESIQKYIKEFAHFGVPSECLAHLCFDEYGITPADLLNFYPQFKASSVDVKGFDEKTLKCLLNLCIDQTHFNRRLLVTNRTGTMPLYFLRPQCLMAQESNSTTDIPIWIESVTGVANTLFDLKAQGRSRVRASTVIPPLEALLGGDIERATGAVYNSTADKFDLRELSRQHYINFLLSGYKHGVCLRRLSGVDNLASLDELHVSKQGIEDCRSLLGEGFDIRLGSCVGLTSDDLASEIIEETKKNVIERLKHERVKVEDLCSVMPGTARRKLLPGWLRRVARALKESEAAFIASEDGEFYIEQGILDKARSSSEDDVKAGAKSEEFVNETQARNIQQMLTVYQDGVAVSRVPDLYKVRFSDCLTLPSGVETLEEYVGALNFAELVQVNHRTLVRLRNFSVSRCNKESFERCVLGLLRQQWAYGKQEVSYEDLCESYPFRFAKSIPCSRQFDIRCNDIFELLERSEHIHVRYNPQQTSVLLKIKYFSQDHLAEIREAIVDFIKAKGEGVPYNIMESEFAHRSRGSGLDFIEFLRITPELLIYKDASDEMIRLKSMQVRPSNGALAPLITTLSHSGPLSIRKLTRRLDFDSTQFGFHQPVDLFTSLSDVFVCYNNLVKLKYRRIPDLFAEKMHLTLSSIRSNVDIEEFGVYFKEHCNIEVNPRCLGFRNWEDLLLSSFKNEITVTRGHDDRRLLRLTSAERSITHRTKKNLIISSRHSSSRRFSNN